MKAICNRESLLAAFGMVSGVIKANTPKPILQNLKLVAESDARSTLLATDLEVGIRYHVAGVRAEQPGAVILPTARMGSILRTSTDEDLYLEAEGDQLLVRGTHAEFKLPSEDPDLFPEVPDFAATAYHAVSAANLRRLIRRTVFATDDKNTRYALNGVLVELGPESITMVGTDGRRLARQVAEAEAEGSVPPAQGSPVVPVKALRLLERNLDDRDPPVHLAIQYNGPVPVAALVRTHDAVLYSRLVAGRFPRYQDVFPGGVEVKVVMDAGPLLRAVEQAAICTSTETRGVDFAFGEGLLKLTSHAADVGSSQVELPIPYDGKPVEITFDPGYLVDALRNLDENAAVTAELIDGRSAAVFKTDDRYTYVVMPLTRPDR